MNTATQEKPVAVHEGLPVQVRRPSLVAKFAAKYNIDPDKLLPILKATAFKQKKGEVSNEQMAALLIVADQYGLNPFTREIFAFPDKQNGIVPVVSVDGWARIINEDVMLNGLEFRYSEKMIEPGDKRCEGLKVEGHEWIEAVIYRKDRDRPIVIREYLEEVYRKPFEYDDGNKKDSAWQTHTKRFHRHKALIQGARIAFGFAGLFDEDEAHRIIEGQVLPTDPLPIEHQRGAAGLRTALGVTDKAESSADFNAAAASNSAALAEGKTKPAGTVEQRDKYVAKFKECKDTEILALVRDEMNGFEWTAADKEVIDTAYSKRQDELGAA